MIDTAAPVVRIKARHDYYFNGAEQEPAVMWGTPRVWTFAGPLKRYNGYILRRNDTETLALFQCAYDLCEFLGKVFGLPLDA